jgi:hypothetical protein
VRSETGIWRLASAFPCLGVLLAAGCATSRPVRTSPVVRSEPPSPVEAPLELPAPIGPISAPGQVEELVPGGAIDWSGKTVRARGSGVLDPGNSSRDEARLLAERAASAVARRNLLEIIKGVRVDSDSRMGDLMADYDTVHRYVEGIVKGARRRDPARHDSLGGTVEVELECDLYGPGGVENALAPVLASCAPSAGLTIDDLSPEAREFLRRYSGLVFDGGSAGLRPALFPRVYIESGGLLLDTRAYLRYAGEPGACAVQFVGALDRLLARPEFGRPPLVLRVKKSDGRLGTDIVLGRAEADRVMWLKDDFRFLMDAGRILVRP